MSPVGFSHHPSPNLRQSLQLKPCCAEGYIAGIRLLHKGDLDPHIETKVELKDGTFSSWSHSVMTGERPTNVLRRFFSGLAEQTFQTHLGVADPPLVDYLSDLLIRFARLDAVYKVRHLSGRPATEIGEMLTEAEARIGDARREVHRHIGDFSLFWAGLYPESLSRRSGRRQLDRFGDYCAQGKRAYFIASTIETDSEESAPADVLERLSHQFEMCAYGLREVRREWERHEDDPESPPPLLLN